MKKEVNAHCTSSYVGGGRGGLGAPGGPCAAISKQFAKIAISVIHRKAVASTRKIRLTLRLSVSENGVKLSPRYCLPDGPSIPILFIFASCIGCAIMLHMPFICGILAEVYRRQRERRKKRRNWA